MNARRSWKGRSIFCRATENGPTFCEWFVCTQRSASPHEAVAEAKERSSDLPSQSPPLIELCPPPIEAHYHSPRRKHGLSRRLMARITSNMWPTRAAHLHCGGFPRGLRTFRLTVTLGRRVTYKLRSALYSSPAKIEHSPAYSNGSFTGKTRHSTNYSCVFRYMFEL